MSKANWATVALALIGVGERWLSNGKAATVAETGRVGYLQLLELLAKCMEK